ncbi:MAG: dihydroorotase [Clostridia bacterium]|nr:dihydroorotase [Clostridia bacterium]
MEKLLIKNAKIVCAKNKINKVADLLIENGKIKEIGENIAVGNAETINAENLTLIPGMVDMHCHLREPGYEYKENIYTGSRAAAKGGFTSIACMANTDPVNDNPAVTTAIIETAKRDSVVNVYPIGAVSKNLEGKELVEMGLMKEAGCVAFSDDGKGVATSKMMYNALQYAKQFEVPVISHCEDKLAEGGCVNEGIMSTRLGLPGISRAAEEIMLFREVSLSEALNVPVHIAHISTKGSVDIIRNAKKRGVKVTCETCPHYIAGTEEMTAEYDTSTKVNPPLRTEEDRLAIIEGIADGTIDAIATDHAPHHIDDKMVEYQLASMGISGFETAFSLCYTNLVETGKISMDKLVELMCTKPAEILNISKGSLSIGADADITIIDENKKHSIDVAAFVSKGKNNPFDGWEVKGQVHTTIVKGTIVYKA